MKTYTITEMLEIAKLERAWLFQNFIYSPSIVILQGRGESMKSLFSLEMSIRLAAGLDFFFDCISPVGTIFWESEDDIIDTSKRIQTTLADIVENGECNEDKIMHLLRNNFNVIDPAIPMTLQNIANTIKENQARFVVLSSLTHFLAANNAKSDIDNIVVVNLFAELRKIIQQHNTCILFIHHFSKSNGNGDDPQAGRGASSITNNARLIMNMNYIADSLISMKIVKCNYRYMLDFTERYFEFRRGFKDVPKGYIETFKKIPEANNTQKKLMRYVAPGGKR